MLLSARECSPRCTGGTPHFPYVLGSEGAGRIVAIGEKVRRFYEGDYVYGFVDARNPKGGFYAEYTAVNEDQVWPVPVKLTTERAGALPIDGGTALRGLRDVLALKRGETLMVFGASGGMGHLALHAREAYGCAGLRGCFKSRWCRVRSEARCRC